MKIDGFEGACPEGWDPVFERVWKGIEEGCRMTYKYNTGKKYQSAGEAVGIASSWEMDNFKRGYDNECTDTIPEVPAISQTDFGGKSICGIRGGQSFAEVQRPNKENDCPTDTSACSSTTSAQNTVCYPPAEHANSCPITEITFVDNSELALISGNFTQVTYSDE